MFLSLSIFVALAKTEVNHVASSSLVSVAHKEVIRFHISMQEIVCVHILQACNHLVCEHADRFQRQLATTVLEQIFE